MTRILGLTTLLNAAYAASIPFAKPPTSRHFNRDIDLYANWPSYDDLPLDASYPTKAAWGVWGPDDQLGALNHITNTTILAASAEIQLGQTIPLNLRLNAPDPPVNPSRKPLTHLFQPGDGYTDDVVVLNTQISTQYDGLRHFAYSTSNSAATYRWYNDLINDYDEVIGAAPTEVLGIHVVAERGIAARGVLIDWAGWMDARNELFDAFSERKITIAELDEVAECQGLSGAWARPGDMLVVRTGWIRQYETLGQTEKNLLPVGNGTSIGLEASDDTLRWLWEKKLSLVGADNPAFESTPLNGNIDGEVRSLHQVFVGGWGQSIVEFLDLERLTAALRPLNRWTFFITVQSLNIQSGIASPPNAMAII
ncbi:Putative cyclase [Macrophomina phaseolina MS6]|uniref:Putative cyclase n=1 Tax=Macrophomina phaseolina (strain MS6) TaxID=1126212 RepID=K2QMP1_MACPH|nr:Putative cyclase [Macrophomina phaseolina MS6]